MHTMIRQCAYPVLCVPARRPGARQEAGVIQIRLGLVEGRRQARGCSGSRSVGGEGMLKKVGSVSEAFA